MKKKKSVLISIAACGAVAVGALPFAAGAADEDVVYGTMNIPYADFYAAELAGSTNVYEVDAVSSATTSKWSKNGEGELFEGTYNEANEDGTGTILGVTYPVAITQAELAALGSENYGFIPLDAEPAAFKTVTVENGKAVFSEVQDSTPEYFSAAASINTNTPWGDYLVDVEGTPDTMGAILGAVLKTESGKSFAMRHEQNIWRGEFAWSSGFKTTEPHGNTLDYENYVALMGETIHQIVYITANGYLTAETTLYVPVKFNGSVVVSDAVSGSGTTTFMMEGFPDDYSKTYSVDGLSAQCSNSEIAYTDALPGQYTLNISDANGVYADMTANFVLSTDAVPAVYSDGKIVKADNASDAEFSNYLKNITSVTVNGVAYSASGKGSTKIISEDGAIDFEASSTNEKVFDGSGNYMISVTATGYTTALDFTIEAGSAEPTETTTLPSSESTSTSTNSSTSSSSAASTTTTTNRATSATTTAANRVTTTSNSTSSPKTGNRGIAIPGMTLAAAVILAAVSRKK